MKIYDKFAMNLEKPVSLHDLIATSGAFPPAFAALQAFETGEAAVVKISELLFSGVTISSSMLTEFGGGDVNFSCTMFPSISYSKGEENGRINTLKFVSMTYSGQTHSVTGIFRLARLK